MGKGIKAGKIKGNSTNTYTYAQVKAIAKDVENQCNKQLADNVRQMKKDAERFKQVTYHNCDLWEQVILFVALKRSENFGEEDMVRVGQAAQLISNALTFNEETFEKLKEELSTVGYEIAEDLWSWE